MNRKLPDNPDSSISDDGRLVHREITGLILKCFYNTYNELGFGFLESVYKNALTLELRDHGLHVLVEYPLKVFYRGVQMGLYRTDHFVEGKVMIEVKSTVVLNQEDPRQIINCLKGGTCDVGLLLHYGPKPNFHRFVHPRYLCR